MVVSDQEKNHPEGCTYLLVDSSCYSPQRVFVVCCHNSPIRGVCWCVLTAQGVCLFCCSSPHRKPAKGAVGVWFLGSLIALKGASRPAHFNTNKVHLVMLILCSSGASRYAYFSPNCGCLLAAKTAPRPAPTEGV